VRKRAATADGEPQGEVDDDEKREFLFFFTPYMAATGREGEGVVRDASEQACVSARGVFSESGKILYRDETCTTKAKRLTFLKEGVFFS
jgi:hypothetical protein